MARRHTVGSHHGRNGSLLRLRLLELAAFALIVFGTRLLTGFSLPDAALIAVLAASIVLQWGFCRSTSVETTSEPGTPDSDGDPRILHVSTALDMITVLFVVHLTGGVESPFLTLVLVPVFFGSRLFRSRSSGVRIILIMVLSMLTLTLLEWRGLLAHKDIYPDWGGEAYRELPLALGTLVILTGLMSLVVYLAITFQDRFALDSEALLRDLQEDSERRIYELNKLYDISTGMNAAMTLDNLLKLVAKEATLLLSASWSCVLLLNRDREVTFASVVGLGSEHLDDFKRVDEGGVVDWILENRREKIVRHLADDREAHATPFLAKAGVRSFIAVPATTGGHVNGILFVGEFSWRNFQQGDVRLLSVLASQLSAAVEKSRVYDALERKIKRLKIEVDELENSNKLKSDFVSHVSHELKTPLTSIKAYIETLISNIENPEFPEAKGFLEVVSNETERLIRIVNKILDVSQIEFGKRRLNREVFDLGELIKDVEASFLPTLKERGIFFIVEMANRLPRLHADRDLVKQVFINLIGNAIKFSSDNSRLYITAAEEAVSIRISVRDEGIGIPQDALANIFDQFYKVREHEEITTEGTGLGLAIVKNIVESHGGVIHAESERGKGTTFTFMLPKEHCFNEIEGRIFELAEDKGRLRDLFETIVRMIAELFSAKIVSLMLLDPDGETLRIQVAYGLDRRTVERTQVALGKGIAGKVADRCVPVLIENIERNEVYQNVNNSQYDTVSLISAPLLIGNQCAGVINVNNKTSKKPFDQDDLNLLVMLCERISRSLERLGELDDPAGYVEETILAFISLIENRRSRIHGKGDSTVRLAAQISRKLGLPEKQVRVVQYVASVHDVGMIRVSNEILNKVVELTPIEFDQIRRHPEESAKILRPLEFVEMVSQNILYHHERMDGEGYPMGLRGEEIPIGARIISVLDAYESMTSVRPYRKPLSDVEAVGEIVRCSGTQFDPEVVEAFLETLVEEGRIGAEVLLRFRSVLKREEKVSHPVS